MACRNIRSTEPALSISGLAESRPASRFAVHLACQWMAAASGQMGRHAKMTTFLTTGARLAPDTSRCDLEDSPVIPDAKPLDATSSSALRRQVLVEGYKWDPQVGDVATLSPFPLVL